MSRKAGQLDKLGYRDDTPGWNEIVDDQRGKPHDPDLFKAMCKSFECAGDTSGKEYKVTYQTTYCPKCGHALCWKRK